MIRARLLASVAVTASLVVAAPRPAHAQFAEVASIAALVALAKQGLTYLTGGASQISNYLKGQVAANQQITDASNTAMARFQRDVRNAQIRDEHILTPSACEALDNGQSIQVSAGNSWVVTTTLARQTDPRGEAGPGMPAWQGQAQAQAANTDLHKARYCSETEVQEGICSTTARPNWDQRSGTLAGVLSYGETPENVSAANDYASTLLQPVPLRALRGDELRSIQGQEQQTWRRRYNAQHSLARSAFNEAVAARTNSVTLTDAQRAQQQAQGLVVTTRGSWMQAIELEVNRYASGRAWATDLQRMPPASVLRETAKLLALNTYVQWQSYRVTERNSLLLAALLADRAETATGRPEAALRGMIGMPVPQMR